MQHGEAALKILGMAASMRKCLLSSAMYVEMSEMALLLGEIKRRHRNFVIIYIFTH